MIIMLNIVVQAQKATHFFSTNSNSRIIAMIALYRKPKTARQHRPVPSPRCASPRCAGGSKAAAPHEERAASPCLRRSTDQQAGGGLARASTRIVAIRPARRSRIFGLRFSLSSCSSRKRRGSTADPAPAGVSESRAH